MMHAYIWYAAIEVWYVLLRTLVDRDVNMMKEAVVAEIMFV